MGTRMTHTARAELTHIIRRRYGAATGTEKRKILDEFIGVRAVTRYIGREKRKQRRQSDLLPRANHRLPTLALHFQTPVASE